MYSGSMPPPKHRYVNNILLAGERKIEVPKQRRKKMNRIDIKGASHFNLKNIDVSIPLSISSYNRVSGSGNPPL